MANPLKKTMVYLGLADEELEYDEQEQVQPQTILRGRIGNAMRRRFEA